MNVVRTVMKILGATLLLSYPSWGMKVQRVDNASLPALPKVIIAKIFQCGDIQDLRRSFCVSKLWHSLESCDQVWELHDAKIVFQILGLTGWKKEDLEHALSDARFHFFQNQLLRVQKKDFLKEICPRIVTTKDCDAAISVYGRIDDYVRKITCAVAEQAASSVVRDIEEIARKKPEHLWKFNILDESKQTVEEEAVFANWVSAKKAFDPIIRNLDEVIEENIWQKIRGANDECAAVEIVTRALKTLDIKDTVAITTEACKLSILYVRAVNCQNKTSTNSFLKEYFDNKDEQEEIFEEEMTLEGELCECASVSALESPRDPYRKIFTDIVRALHDQIKQCEI